MMRSQSGGTWTATTMVLVGSLVLGACADRRAATDTGRGSEAKRASAGSERLFVARGLTPLWSLRGAADSAFGDLSFVRTDGQHVYAWDRAARAVVAFDSAGAFRWRAGRSGSAPGEYRRVVDVQADHGGGVVLLDNETRRVTRLTPDGRLRSTTTLAVGGLLAGWLPRDNGRALLFVNAADSVLRLVDSTGTTDQVLPHPDPEFLGLPMLNRQGALAGSIAGEWVFAYTTASRWISAGSTAAGSVTGETPDRIPFPEIEQSGSQSRQVQRFAAFSPCAICDVTVDGGDLYLLSGGRDSTVKRVVDRYAVHDGRYLGSYLLPSEARSIAVADGRLYVALEDPAPVLTAFAIAPLTPAGTP